MKTHRLAKVISMGLIIAAAGAFAPIAYAQGAGAAGRCECWRRGSLEQQAEAGALQLADQWAVARWEMLVRRVQIVQVLALARAAVREP